jgi:Putative transposase
VQQLQRAFEAGTLVFPTSIAELATREAFGTRLGALRQTEWVVFAKPPFATPTHVLTYLGRYTHRVAIANSRLVELAGGRVSFTWKDYRDGGKTKIMTLSADEFMRRFVQHTIPGGFHRIRQFGFLANGHRSAKLALCRRLLAIPPPPPPTLAADYRERYLQLTGVSLDICPDCGGQMRDIGPLPKPARSRYPLQCDTS